MNKYLILQKKSLGIQSIIKKSKQKRKNAQNVKLKKLNQEGQKKKIKVLKRQLASLLGKLLTKVLGKKRRKGRETRNGSRDSKISNIRIVSFGTGHVNTNREKDDLMKEHFKAKEDEHESMIMKTIESLKGKVFGFADKKFLNVIDDPGTEKEGIRDWANVEVAKHLFFDT